MSKVVFPKCLEWRISCPNKSQVGRNALVQVSNSYLLHYKLSCSIAILISYQRRRTQANNGPKVKYTLHTDQWCCRWCRKGHWAKKKNGGQTLGKKLTSAGPDYDALDPEPDEGEEWPEGGVDVGIVCPGLGDHCAWKMACTTWVPELGTFGIF